ncbi:hypothetical protein [Cyclobacterium sediminis]
MTDSVYYNIDTFTNMMYGYNHHSDSIASQVLQNQQLISEKLNDLSKDDKSILFLILGAILGLALTLLWEYIMAIKKNCHFRNKLKKYEGLYLAFNKYDTVDSKPFRCFELKQDKNKLRIVNGISLLGYEDYKGEINMLDKNLNFGSGYFQHNKAPDNFIGFGFLEVQLTGDEILVHETIYNDGGKQNSDPYRWIKQDSKKREEIIKGKRLLQKEEFKEKYKKQLKED